MALHLAPNKLFRKQGALEAGDASLAPWCVSVVHMTKTWMQGDPRRGISGEISTEPKPCMIGERGSSCFFFSSRAFVHQSFPLLPMNCAL
jgi:hypothetical protein